MLPDAGDPLLIEQERLHRRPRGLRQRVQVLARERRARAARRRAARRRTRPAPPARAPARRSRSAAGRRTPARGRRGRAARAGGRGGGIGSSSSVPVMRRCMSRKTSSESSQTRYLPRRAELLDPRGPAPPRAAPPARAAGTSARRGPPRPPASALRRGAPDDRGSSRLRAARAYRPSRLADAARLRDRAASEPRVRRRRRRRLRCSSVLQRLLERRARPAVGRACARLPLIFSLLKARVAAAAAPCAPCFCGDRVRGRGRVRVGEEQRDRRHVVQRVAAWRAGERQRVLGRAPAWTSPCSTPRR